VKTLFCTVGGSPAPVIKTIKKHEPEKIFFVCSLDDPVTMHSGSYTMIEGEGNVIKSSPGNKPDLPNIPTQLGLEPESWEVIKVPSDDPAAIVTELVGHLQQAAHNRRVIADYTGGTKSMSVGLFLAALQVKDVEISQVSGPRVNLIQVSDGYEVARVVDVAALQDIRLLEQARGAWKRFAYSEANALLSSRGSVSPDLQRTLVLGRGFDAWDHFNHQKAYDLLKPMAGQIDQKLMPVLASLRKNDPNRRDDALRIWDLRLMAERREVQRNFDVAILLYYRLVEWVAQWTLRWDHNLNTSDIPTEIADRFPDLVSTNRRGNLVVGLYSAWKVLSQLDGPLAESAREIEKELMNFTQRRNSSIFAHGVTPVGESDFVTNRNWVKEAVIRPFLNVAFKGTEPYPQIPNDFDSVIR
jgi:CRISPR-associated protein (TIGR02710 family)